MVDFRKPLVPLPTTRDEALESGSDWYFTGKPCVNGHVSARDTKTKRCRSCAQSHGNSSWDIAPGATPKSKSIAQVKENISEKQRRNRIEAELELARIEKRYRGYDE